LNNVLHGYTFYTVQKYTGRKARQKSYRTKNRLKFYFFNIREERREEKIDIMDTEGDVDQINLGCHRGYLVHSKTNTSGKNSEQRELELEDENKWTEFGLGMVWGTRSMWDIDR
jgi:hypothetical protein